MQRDEWGRRGGKRDTSGTAVCMAFHFSVILKPPFYPFLLPYSHTFFPTLPYPHPPLSRQTNNVAFISHLRKVMEKAEKENRQKKRKIGWMDSGRKEEEADDVVALT